MFKILISPSLLILECQTLKILNQIYPSRNGNLMSFVIKIEKFKQAMMTLQGMADHRFTSVSLFTNVFLGEIIFFPLNFFPLIFVY